MSSSEINVELDTQAAHPVFILDKTRIRNNSYSVQGQGKPIRVNHVFHRLKPGEVMPCSKTRYLGTCSVCLSKLRLSDGELLMIDNHHRNNKPSEFMGCGGK